MKDSGNQIVRIYGYTYDVANNLTAKTRVVASPASYDSWVYGYDNANEQTSVTLNGGTPETRTYDAWGRMATRTQGALSGTYGYRYGGKLYSYAGNFGGEAPETMQYRGDGRLYSRVSGTATKVYRYDRGWNAINEEDGAGNLTASSVYAPTSEVGERLAWVSGAMGSGTWNYAYHDQLGSTRRWRSATKALLGSNDYGPYGEKYTSYSGAPFDYALHVQDPYTLLYHAPYREYATGWARWTTRDPLGMVDGPNMFGYAKDNPVRKNDVWGLFSIKGDCNNNTNDIGASVTEACEKLDAWVTPDLKACMEKRCKTGTIKCKRSCEWGCRTGDQGYNIGKGKFRSHTAVICVDNPQSGGFVDTAIHEWVHSCGYDGQDDKDKVPPYGDGQ